MAALDARPSVRIKLTARCPDLVQRGHAELGCQDARIHAKSDTLRLSSNWRM